jgi:hypothetical protein
MKECLGLPPDDIQQKEGAELLPNQCSLEAGHKGTAISGARRPLRARKPPAPFDVSQGTHKKRKTSNVIDSLHLKRNKTEADPGKRRLTLFQEMLVSC